jgi:hypothetical protein
MSEILANDLYRNPTDVKVKEIHDKCRDSQRAEDQAG